MNEYIVELKNPAQTKKLGRDIAVKVSDRPALIFIEGDLGAGKTTLIQGFIETLITSQAALSPTYAYLHIYEYKLPIYHFDLYRISEISEIYELGLWEFIENDQAIRLIEWPQRLNAFVGPDININISSQGEARSALVRYL